MFTDRRLYGILDLGYVEAAAAAAMTRQMLEGGVQVLQLRAKRLPEPAVAALAMELAPICREHGVPFFINDHPQLVAACGADGVHIGQDDGPLEAARVRATADSTAAQAGRPLVGRSTHSLDQVRAACAEGADYLGFGPLFATPTKPDYRPIGLEDIPTASALAGERPVFCIGGIKLEHLERLRAAGAQRVVIVSGILQAPDVRAYCRACREVLA